MITRLAHICIGASDLEATERFYCGGLGLKRGFEFIKDGRVIGFYLAVGGGNYIEVFHSAEADVQARAPIKHICLEVTDIDRVIAALRTGGYEVSDKRMGADGAWQAWTKDPGGVDIEFHQYTPNCCQLTGAPCRLD